MRCAALVGLGLSPAPAVAALRGRLDGVTVGTAPGDQTTYPGPMWRMRLGDLLPPYEAP